MHKADLNKTKDEINKTWNDEFVAKIIIIIINFRIILFQFKIIK
jgi:hypothetical protein